ncbi:hypothetical protein BJX63DRAFT_438771, partial [Aspergillus granulosus]
GTGDNFYKQGQLLPENLEKAAKEAGVTGINVRYQPDYDHSYFTMATFSDDHVEHAAKYLFAYHDSNVMVCGMYACMGTPTARSRLEAVVDGSTFWTLPVQDNSGADWRLVVRKSSTQFRIPSHMAHTAGKTSVPAIDHITSLDGKTLVNRQQSSKCTCRRHHISRNTIAEERDGPRCAHLQQLDAEPTKAVIGRNTKQSSPRREGNAFNSLWPSG